MGRLFPPGSISKAWRLQGLRLGDPSKLPFMRELQATVPFQGDSGPCQLLGTELAPGRRGPHET